MFQDILIEVSNKIATITLNRATFSNALAKTTYGEIEKAVEMLDQDAAVKTIVITGDGKHFSAGGDIKRFKLLIDSGEFLTEEGITYAGGMSRAIKKCSKPVIAMINGVATGAGFSLALACDYRIVSKESKMIMSFVKLGLPGDTGSIYFLAKLVGIEKASLMMMNGDAVGGEEAVKLGLATCLAGEGELKATTYSFAQKLTEASSYAIARQKALLYKYFYGELNDYLKDEAATMAKASREPDFKEAVYAFLEKRTPQF